MLSCPRFLDVQGEQWGNAPSILCGVESNLPNLRSGFPLPASPAQSENRLRCLQLEHESDRVVGITTARAGNVIGGGVWSDDRLIPGLNSSF